MQSLSIAEAQEITFDTSAVPDIHAYLAGLRAHGPIARSKMGVVFALRHQHLELITRDVTRQIETEAKLIQGVISGPVFDFVKSSMLFSNGDVHLRRRAPVSRTFAFKSMDAMRPKAAALAAELVKRPPTHTHTHTPSLKKLTPAQPPRARDAQSAAAPT